MGPARVCVRRFLAGNAPHGGISGGLSAGNNQHGGIALACARMLLAQELTTAIAGRPCWGPMYGSQAVSEQALTEQILGPAARPIGVDGRHQFWGFHGGLCRHAA